MGVKFFPFPLPPQNFPVQALQNCGIISALQSPTNPENLVIQCRLVFLLAYFSYVISIQEYVYSQYPRRRSQYTMMDTPSTLGVVGVEGGAVREPLTRKTKKVGGGVFAMGRCADLQNLRGRQNLLPCLTAGYFPRYLKLI